jgi:hypothetical protein
MNNTVLTKGQKVTSPKEQGEVEEIIADKVVIQLDNGHYETFLLDEVEDNSSAG